MVIEIPRLRAGSTTRATNGVLPPEFSTNHVDQHLSALIRANGRGYGLRLIPVNPGPLRT